MSPHVVQPTKSSAEAAFPAPERNRVPLRSLPGRAVPACALFLLLIYGACWNDRWELKGDSAQYLLLGESLAQGAGYTISGVPHTYFPPGFPLLLAAFHSVGLGEMIWLNLAMLLMHLAMLAAGFCLLCHVTSPRSALLAIMLAACAHPVFKGSIAILSDTPFALLMLVGMYGYRRGCREPSAWIEFGTLALAAACWLRLVGYLVAVAAGVAFFMQVPIERRTRAVANVAALVLLVLASAGWFANRYQTGIDRRSNVYTGEISEVTERSGTEWVVRPIRNAVQSGQAFSLFFTGQEIGHSAGFVLFIMPVMAGMVIYFRRREFIVALVPAVYLAVLMAIRPPIARYLLPVAPFIALFFVEWVDVLRERLFVWWKRFDVVAVTMAGFMIACLVRDVRFIADRHAPLNRSHGAEWRELAKLINDSAQPSAAFTSTREGPLVSYLSKRPWKEPGPLFAESNGSIDGLDAALRRSSVDIVMLEPMERCPGSLKPAHQLLESLVADHSRFELVLTQDVVRVYRRISGSIADRDSDQIF